MYLSSKDFCCLLWWTNFESEIPDWGLQWQFANMIKPIGFLRLGNFFILGGNPGQVIMGGELCSKGYEFKSQHRILDGHFHIYLL